MSYFLCAPEINSQLKVYCGRHNNKYIIAIKHFRNLGIVCAIVSGTIPRVLKPLLFYLLHFLLYFHNVKEYLSKCLCIPVFSYTFYQQMPLSVLCRIDFRIVRYSPKWYLNCKILGRNLCHLMTVILLNRKCALLLIQIVYTLLLKITLVSCLCVLQYFITIIMILRQY